MAFSVRNLSVLAYANGFTLWHYKAGSTALETTSAGFLIWRLICLPLAT